MNLYHIMCPNKTHIVFCQIIFSLLQNFLFVCNKNYRFLYIIYTFSIFYFYILYFSFFYTLFILFSFFIHYLYFFYFFLSNVFYRATTGVVLTKWCFMYLWRLKKVSSSSLFILRSFPSLASGIILRPLVLSWSKLFLM